MISIFDQVGPTVPHHFAMRVRKGRIRTAAAFFTEFLGGWTEVKERRASLPWGEIRWIKNIFNPAVLVQLTEVYKDDGEWSNEMHLALACHFPRQAAMLTQQLFVANLSAEEPVTTVEDLGNSKYWVEIRAVFGSPIEFVPIE